jgi:hypothetical protein
MEAQGATVERGAEPQTKEVYLASTRVFVADVVAQVCAAACFIGVLGAIFTWGKHSALFDFANSPHGVDKAQLGFLFGPALILFFLPLVRRMSPRVAYTRHYRTRVGVAAALWLIGLLTLVSHLSGLDAEYTLQAGAYVATTLISVGLLATLAMWPAGLRTGLLDRRGEVQPST